MKYVKSFESHREYVKSEKINEELGELLNLFKNLWNKSTVELKKLGNKPTMEQLDQWIEKNIFNPSSPSYIFKGVIDTFKKKKDTETNGDACVKFISEIIDPNDGSLGKTGTQPLYDILLKSFGKNLAPTSTIEYYFNTARNRAIKDYKYAGGPDGGKVDTSKVITSLDDDTHLPDLKKILKPNKDDNKKMKESTINWVEKTLIPRILKYIQEIKPEDVKKYLETKGIKEGGESSSMNYKTLEELYKKKTEVIYLLKGREKEEWDQLTDEEKKNPKEGNASKIVGVKVINSINDQDKDDSVTFLDQLNNPTIKKGYKDIIGPFVSEKVDGQEDLTNQLKDIKTKNPESIKKIGDIAKLYSDPNVNKDKIDQIEKTLGETK